MSGAQSEPLALHEQHMARALDLAEQGRGTTAPNPLVGCVVVRDDEIVGEGWHLRAGEPHAEVNALRSAGDAARNATVYVTLEPCNHTGRTPPCTEALIQAGVRRVVVATLDPNPLVNGAGVKRLHAAGVEVVVGVLEDEAQGQNEAFFSVHRLGRPTVLYKTAMTLDGKLATRNGQSRWITGAAARERVQGWRRELGAVAVGVNTVLLDDPLLTSRLEGSRTPVKVIFDSAARTPTTAKLLEPDERGRAARVLVFATEQAPKERVAALEAHGAEVVRVSSADGRADIGSALVALSVRGLNSLLLEGGGTLAWSFFAAKAVDRVAWFIAPKLLGGAGSSPLGGLGVPSLAEAITLDELRTEVVGDDLLISGRVRYPEPETAAG